MSNPFRQWFRRPAPAEQPAAGPPAAPVSAPPERRPLAFAPAPAQASSLYRSLDFLRGVVGSRLDQYFGHTAAFVQPAFAFADDGSAFARFVTARQLKVEFILLLGLARWGPQPGSTRWAAKPPSRRGRPCPRA